jgi:hypothetical protein
MKLIILGLVALSSFSAFANTNSICTELAQQLPNLTTPEVRVGPFAFWNNANKDTSYLIKAIEINPAICDHLKRVINFATSTKVKALAERSEAIGAHTIIEVHLSRGEIYGSRQNNGSYTYRNIYGDNYENGYLDLENVSLSILGNENSKYFGCSLVTGNDQCANNLKLGIEKLEAKL